MEEWILSAQLGRLKTGQDGKGLLPTHLCCPDDLPRLWDRTENNRNCQLYFYLLNHISTSLLSANKYTYLAVFYVVGGWL